MSNILCLYYSRSGNTMAAMEEVAQMLDAELVEITDGQPRLGKLGYLRCCFDAVRRTSLKTMPIAASRPLDQYQLVILGTPVWVGRCSSVMRSFLKYHGYKIPAAAFLITRSGEVQHREVYEQMDQYLSVPRVAEVSLRPGDTGYRFWINQFVTNIKNQCHIQE